MLIMKAHIVSLLGSGEESLEFAFIISVLLLECGDLVFVGPLLALAFLLVALDSLVDVDVEALDLLGKALALLLQLSYLILHVVLALLSHESLAHAISDGAFI